MDIYVTPNNSHSNVVVDHDNAVDEYNNTIVREVKNKINELKKWVARTTLKP